MNASKIVVKNAAILTAGRFLSRIAQFFLFIYAARMLGADHFGIFSFANNLVYMLWLIMDIGMSRYSIQQMSRDSQVVPLYVGTGVVLKFFLVSFGYIVIVGTGWLMGKDILTIKSLAILATAAAFDAFAMTFSAAFDAEQKMFYSTLSTVISKSIMTAFGFILLSFYGKMLLFCGIMVSGSLLQLIMTVYLYFKVYKKLNFNFDFDFIKKIIKNSLPFSASHIFVTIYYSIDSVMLDFFCGATVVGYYNAAYRIIDAPLFISESFKIALFPAISKLYAKNIDELNILVSRSCNTGLAIGISIASATAFLAEKIIFTCYGKEYAPSAKVLPVLIFSIAFMMPSTICSTTIRASDRQSVCVTVSGFGVLLNIILNLILIPKYSFLGAAWATLFTEMIIATIYIEIAKRYVVGPIFKIKKMLRILLMPLLIIILLYATDALSIWIQITGCIIIFFPISFLAGVFTFNELKNMLR